MLITPESLRGYIAQREEEKGEPLACDLLQYAAAIAVIRAALGQEWISSRLSSTTGDPYVQRADGVDGIPSFQHQDRVTDLGELLFNMQAVPGFKLRVRKLRANSLESAIAELEGARFIHSTGAKYRFVTETSVKGCDFDVEVMLGDIAVACEMKAKMNGTEPSAKSVHRRLNRARNQLPRNAPGMIFMKIPRSWLSDPDCQVALDDGVMRLFRGTGRIAAVFVLWEEWIDRRPGAIRFTRFHHWRNSRSRTDISSLVRAITDTAESVNQRWVELWTIVCAESDRMQRLTLNLGLRIQQWNGNPETPLPRGVFPSAIYRGSLAALRNHDPDQIRTAIHFRCPQFPLFRNAMEHENNAGVSVSTGDIRKFTIRRNAAEQTFVICIPRLVHDIELHTVDGTAVLPPVDRIHRATAMLNQGESPEEVDDGDPLIDSVRRLFTAMRTDGDLPPQLLSVCDVRAVYFHGESQAPVFQVDYPGRQFTV